MTWRTRVLVFLTIAVGTANWFLWPSEPAEPPKDVHHTLYLWCPKCNFEMPCGPGQDKQTLPCPHCTDRGSILELSFVSHQETARAGNPFLALTLIDVNYLMAGTLLIASGRKHDQASEQPLYFIYVCRDCRRRLRYQDHQVGHLARCPACKTPFMFPEPTSDPLPVEELQ